MSTAVLRYKSNDGVEWQSAEAADRRDDLLWRIERAQSLLRPPTDKHGEFVQQDASDVRLYKHAIIALAKEFAPGQIWERDPDSIYPRSFAGRYLDDACSPLSAAWVRLMRTDHLSREWDQPYFAIQADKTKQGE